MRCSRCCWRRQLGVPLGLPLALVVLVIFQGLLGMWTVTLLLKPLIVTLHLIFGLTTLSMLWWLWLTLRRRSSDPWSGTRSAIGGGSAAALVRPAPQWPCGARRWSALIALAMQIMLGGWTSTNYAAVSCPDFPQVPGLVVARGRFPGRLRAVARTGHQLRRRRAAAAGARGHPLHASAGRGGRDAGAAVRGHRDLARAT